MPRKVAGPFRLRHVAWLVPAIVIPLTALSCATVVNGMRQKVKVSSVPQRSQFVVADRDGKQVARGVTGMSHSLLNLAVPLVAV